MNSYSEEEVAMKGEQQQVGKAAQELGKQLKETMGEEKLNQANKQMSRLMPKEFMGLSDAMIEGIYGQAYRLYNTGKYREAGQLFRLLIMVNGTEAKYAMGLAACLHMLKDFKAAAEAYMLCTAIDAHNPIPHYHASDCYIQMKDKLSALVSLELAVQQCGDKPEYKTLKDRAQMTIQSLKKDLQTGNQEKKPSSEPKK